METKDFNNNIVLLYHQLWHMFSENMQAAVIDVDSFVLSLLITYVSLKLHGYLTLDKFHYISRSNTFQSIKLIYGKALRKHSMHEKTAASVLLKLFISGNE